MSFTIISFLKCYTFLIYLIFWKEVNVVREGIHPEYHQVTVKCNCGNEFVTGSTNKEIRVEVCSKCHPFYTGSQKLLLEAGGRVEKFNKKYGRK